jgi:hypothetical protein
MKLTRPIILVLLCIAFVPSLAMGQTAEIDAFREKAEKGDVEAQVGLGNLYAFGQDQKNRKHAVKWYRCRNAVSRENSNQGTLSRLLKTSEVPDCWCIVAATSWNCAT